MPCHAHIGLGKCATTTLQKHVFPAMAAAEGMRYLDLGAPYTRLLRAGRPSTALDAALPDLNRCFLSCEGLLGWDPREWRGRVDFLATQLPTDARVIVTVRAPRDYLYSVYIQRTLHSGTFLPPSHFFLGEDAYRPDCAHPVFSMADFDLGGLVARLRATFDDVLIVPFEEIVAGRFLRREIGQHKRENRSLGAFSYATLSRIDRGLGHLGLGLASGEVQRAADETALLLGEPSPRRRFPLRGLLSRVDRGKKVAEAQRVIDGFGDILARETAFYETLLAPTPSAIPADPTSAPKREAAS